MKKLLIIVIFLLSVILSLKSQDVDTIRGYKPVISIENLNVLFAGVDNLVAVAIPGYLPGRIKVLSSCGEIRGDSGNYVIYLPIRAEETNQKLKLSVFIKKNDSCLTFTGEKIFEIRKVPLPDIYFGSKHMGGIYPEEACATDSLIIKCPENYFNNFNWKIAKFEFIYAPVSGAAKFVKVMGNHLTPEMKTYIKVLHKGDRLIFTNIFVILNGSIETRAADLVLTVK